MTPQRHAQIKEVFLAVCELDEASRSAFLRQACEGDPGLRAEVESLLVHHDEATILEHAGNNWATASLPGERPSTEPAGDTTERPPRFLPGTVVADRYRVVSLLGRGGMGEVYRADDTKLQRPVALKFMVHGRAQDGVWLARFYQEARLSLTITHPNICRVYDVGEAAGEAFISMEYVDGENLASLLRRIGRLPREKALELARQLCTGLASAHAQGVLHRDLKPANVMIDGRGQVRITDFGIAVPMTDEGSRRNVAGTLTYMAPELLMGRPATVRSDLYALGVILYEMITGVHPFAGFPIERGPRSSPAPPSAIAADIDAALERTILRCLQADPEERPHSAHEISASLPGGDLLTSAIEAGETPSPEMVAAAGGEKRLHPRIAIAISALAAAGLAAVVLLADRTLLLSASTLVKSPHVLEDRADDIVRQLGGDTAGPPMQSGFALVHAVAAGGRLVAAPTEEADESAPLGPPSIVFECYEIRNDPMSLLSNTSRDAGPAETVQTLVRMDPAGRLRCYLSVPKRLPSGSSSEAAVDWSTPARLAGIPLSGLHPAAPSSPPPVFADTVRAWEGPSGFDPGLKVHVEGASLAGRTVYYDVKRIQATRPGVRASQPLAWQRPSLAYEAASILFLVTLAGGCVLAGRNLRLGRGDRRGAWRIALFMFGLEMVIWVIGHRFSPRPLAEAQQIIKAIQLGVFAGAGMWVFYIGLEPYVRRLWPQSIISWSRLLAGRLNDPLIGRDVLVGVAFAAGIILLQQMNVLLLSEQRLPPQMLQPGSSWGLGQLLGFQHTAEALAKGLRTALVLAMSLLMLMLLLRLVLKIPAVAGAVFFFIVSIIYLLGSPLMTLPCWLTCGITAGGTTVLLLRFGFLATVAGLLSVRLLLSSPLTADTRAWCAGSTAFVLLVLLTMLGFGLYTTLKRPVMKASLGAPM